MVNHGYELLEVCSEKNMSIWEYILKEEAKGSELSKKEVFEKMRENLKVMQAAAEYGMKNEVKSVSGIIGGDARRLSKYANEGNTLTGPLQSLDELS